MFTSQTYLRPCGNQCSGIHYVGGFRSQLNPCVFFDYCYGLYEQDSHADFIFSGIRDGFRIEDADFDGSYFCPNYKSALEPRAKAEMDRIISNELALGKVSRVVSKPSCVHSLGAIRKSDGSVRPITDCRRPLGTSINNHMDKVCQDFSYISLDQVSALINPVVFSLFLTLSQHIDQLMFFLTIELFKVLSGI